MARKQGFKNKHLKRVVVTTLAAGIILISTIGFNIYDRLPNLDKEDPALTDAVIGDEFDDVHNLNPGGPEITTDPSDTIPPDIFNGFVPEPDIEIEDEIIAEENFDEDMIEILAILTNATRHYFESVTGEPSDATHSSVDHIIPNNNNSITIYGKGQSGSKIKRMVTTISGFDISDYSTDPNKFAEQFKKDLIEIPLSQYSIKTETYYQVTNPNIATSLLNARLKELKTSDTNNPEIQYINNLLANLGKLKLLIVDPISTKTDSGNYKTNFTLILSTEKYGYTAQGGFETTYQLRGNDKYVAIENYVQNNISSITINSTPQSEINKTLYEINEKAEELQNNNSLTK